MYAPSSPRYRIEVCTHSTPRYENLSISCVHSQRDFKAEGSDSRQGASVLSKDAEVDLLAFH